MKVKETHGNDMIRLVCRESDSLIVEISDYLETENSTETVSQVPNNDVLLFALKWFTSENESAANQRIVHIVSWNIRLGIYWLHIIHVLCIEIDEFVHCKNGKSSNEHELQHQCHYFHRELQILACNVSKSISNARNGKLLATNDIERYHPSGLFTTKWSKRIDCENRMETNSRWADAFKLLK